jgi:hypothetical protein
VFRVQERLIHNSQSALNELLIRPGSRHGMCLIVSLFVCALLIPVWVLAETSVPSDEYKIKAAVIHHVSRFTAWQLKFSAQLLDLAKVIIGE